MAPASAIYIPKGDCWARSEERTFDSPRSPSDCAQSLASGAIDSQSLLAERKSNLTHDTRKQSLYANIGTHSHDGEFQPKVVAYSLRKIFCCPAVAIVTKSDTTKKG